MFLRAASFALCLFGLPAAAQCVGDGYLDQLDAAERASLDAAAAQTPFGQGLVWDATKDGKRALLIGTMHIYDPRLEAIRDQVKSRVQGTDLLLVEATSDQEVELQNLIVTDPGILFITEGPTLPELLDDETWEAIADAASARSIPGFMASKMQPWYLSMMLSIPPCAMQDLTQGNRGLDHMIMQDAAAAGVPMQSLESVMTLFEIFQQDPMDEQIDMLRVNILAPEQQRQMFVSMLDRYFDGDIATLWEMSRLAISQTPGMSADEASALFTQTENALLIDRNRNWMPVIGDAVDQHDDVVIAVGAAHLMGVEGLLQFLSDDGWTLDQLPSTSP
ncbi:TraB/GumN family protein [Yoonia sp. SS1-5]|uniref:TraB/GumN family protein n=1 Tax=Yoonia rhodophyticola TaxID=3137370 RepID=A0AAN0MGQ9_9RHOB